MSNTQEMMRGYFNKKVDEAFRKAVGFDGCTSNADTGQTMSLGDLLEQMKRVQAELGPPPPKVRLSKHATALPDREPKSDYMKAYVEAVGRRRLPAAFYISHPVGRFGFFDNEMIVIHPDLLDADD